jgi:hypothetical protein
MTKFILISFFAFIANWAWAQQDVSGQDTCKLTIPNSVTMNSESTPNGEFIITSKCSISKFSIEIFSRWGNSLYKSSQITEHWNTSKVESGVYVYLIKYKNSDGKEEELTGHVTVLK